jgi:hypothetical protein
MDRLSISVLGPLDEERHHPDNKGDRVKIDRFTLKVSQKAAYANTTRSADGRAVIVPSNVRARCMGVFTAI